MRGRAPLQHSLQLSTLPLSRRSELICKISADAGLMRDGQRPHPVAAHRGRPGAAPRTSSRPTHLCAGMTAAVPDWCGAVGSALHTVSREKLPASMTEVAMTLSVCVY